jgi:hypothetical protein
LFILPTYAPKVFDAFALAVTKRFSILIVIITRNNSCATLHFAQPLAAFCQDLILEKNLISSTGMDQEEMGPAVAK